MVRKVLRSLILESLPLDLRVQLDLISRRRDIIGEEKNDEIIRQLLQFGLDDFIQIGPGTNRYAVKYNGYVVKVATDNDGKIDNFKEFKMSKRLYPDMTKTHEVSQNGNLLVAEYIPPFESYSMMLRYKDKIIKKLNRISKVFLIGDVGIAERNHKNWGLRPGSEDPTCLDYAYIYNVKSKLFTCTKCGSMLVPTSDYVDLQCINKTCGKIYTFESIRMRLGNDIHNHEIGDLTEEGYLLSSSFTDTELTTNRSNYLVKMKKKKKETIVEDKVEEVEFIMPDSSNIKGGNKMGDSNFINEMAQGMKLSSISFDDYDDDTPVASISFDDDDFEDDEEEVTIETHNNDEEETVVENESSLAFEVGLNPDIEEELDSYEDEDDLDDEEDEEDYEEVEIPSTEVFQSPIMEEIAKEVLLNDNTSPIIDLPERKEEKVEEIEAPKFDIKPDKVGYPITVKIKKEFLNSFNIKNGPISKLANIIGESAHQMGIYEYIAASLKRKIYKEELYKDIQNSAFNSLMQFFGFTSEKVTLDNGKTITKWNHDRKVFYQPYSPSLVFLERIWFDDEILESENIIHHLNSKADYYYPDEYNGIQLDWIDLFKSRLALKVKYLEFYGIMMVAEKIASIWCMENPEVVEEPEEPEADEEESEEAAFENKLENELDISQAIFDQGKFIIDLMKNDSYDVLRISCEDQDGLFTIPFYIDDWKNVDNTAHKDSLTYEQNKNFDWCIHFMPIYKFNTTNPEKYLAMNEKQELGEEMNVFAVLDTFAANSGESSNLIYSMGLYEISQFNIYEESGSFSEEPFTKDDLMKVNAIVTDNIKGSNSSFLKYTRYNNFNRVSESKIEEYLSDRESFEEKDDDLMDAEKAAIAAMLDDIEEDAPAVSNESLKDLLQQVRERDAATASDGIFHPIRKKDKKKNKKKGKKK